MHVWMSRALRMRSRRTRGWEEVGMGGKRVGIPRNYGGDAVDILSIIIIILNSKIGFRYLIGTYPRGSWQGSRSAGLPTPHLSSTLRSLAATRAV